MHPLTDDLRKKLEETVKMARERADWAALAALGELGVGDAAAPTHLNEDGRDLRRRLRAHGRQLGDLRRGDSQEIERLREEIAYEHWHRMLFARFLAENHLLMYPDPLTPVPVTLAECEDLAADEGAAFGATNGWELAARFAARMLPQIFRTDSPVFALTLPPEHQRALERLLADLPADLFTASDALGWAYQFWQARRKDEVNAAEVKIGARELPAVTQLFTEPYMVAFLLDNALGAWWAARRLSQDDLRHAPSEDDLRRRAALPGVPLDYLRFVQDETGWRPAAGDFAAWPQHLGNLKALDPCCGSGHFLVALLLMLVPMRMEMEALSPQAAVDAVLRQNLYGLELDARCVEVAAFALALAAWRYPGAGGYRKLPELNLACSGLAVAVPRDEWRRLARGDQNLRLALDWLYDEFADAPVLGSLINPLQTQAARLTDPQRLLAAVQNALAPSNEKSRTPQSAGDFTGDVTPRVETPSHSNEKSPALAPPADDSREAAVTAQGLARAAALLGDRYTWVVTNVPYLARGKQDETLRDFCERRHPEAKNDLATVFLDRCLAFCAPGGATSVVLPQNWLFLTSYRAFREKLLRNDTWHLIARLGAGAFRTISGEVVKAILITLSRGNGEMAQAGLWAQDGAPSAHIAGLDVSAPRTTEEKASLLVGTEIKLVEQIQYRNSSDFIISMEERKIDNLLGKYVRSLAGTSSGDTFRFCFRFWEMNTLLSGWIYHLSSVTETKEFHGREQILLYEDGTGALSQGPGGSLRNVKFWGQPGVTVTLMRHLPASRSLGESWDRNCACLVPYDQRNLLPLWTFCMSPEFAIEVRKLNQKLSVAEAIIERIPFDLDHWSQVAAEKYPNGLPHPYADDPTQWIFHGHPCGSVVWDETAKRLVHGPLRRDESVLQVAAARLLGYRWPAERDTEMVLAAEARQWVERAAALVPYADTDGIVCIPPVRGEPSAADRLLNLLAAAYGDDWSGSVLAELLAAADHAGKSLESWLRDKFFSRHMVIFQHRPFVWHIWDGLRDGFAALVNYHRLDHKTLEALIYTYLGDWISRQKQEIVLGVDGAQEKLAAAETLKRRLELILVGEEPHDIFVRWKSLAQQPMGWSPDLNDGVRLNIRPFLSVADVGKKGAGVLRDRPNVNWGKDRGKDVESAPWYAQFGGDRINDYHVSLAEKRRARD